MHLLMTNKTFKLSIIVLFFAGFAVLAPGVSRVTANSGGPPSSRTGAPGEPTCATSNCHVSFPLNSGPGTLSITGLPATYAPNQEIVVTVTLNQTNRQLYGFEATALDAQNKKAGELSATEPARTQKITGVVSGGLREYIEHNFAGTSPNGANQGSWTFKWKAPAQSIGPVTFYVAGNAANGSGTELGDYIYTKTATIQPAPALTPFASVSAASFALNGSLTPDGIVAGFGAGLSTNVAQASALPLPTTLDGTSVLVNGVAAPLFFVSPGQINYLIPTATANGTATITVQRNGVDTAQGTATIDTVAPALFSANASGQGVAAAVLLRRRNGVDSFEPVAQFNQAAGRFDPIPIDLGPDTDLVVLLAFGTGFRAAPQTAVSATIGGTASTFVATAPVGGFAGLDQANILIPNSLAGRNGLVDVVFMAAGKTANTVQLFIK